MFGREKDPVCGMKVKKSEAVAKSDYRGKTYYFCAVACKEKFDKEPDKYLGKATSKKHEM